MIWIMESTRNMKQSNLEDKSGAKLGKHRWVGRFQDNIFAISGRKKYKSDKQNKKYED